MGSKFVQSFDTCLQRAIAHSGTKKTPVYTVLARDRNYIRTIQLILQLAGPMLLPVARESNWRIWACRKDCTDVHIECGSYGLEIDPVHGIWACRSRLYWCIECGSYGLEIDPVHGIWTWSRTRKPPPSGLNFADSVQCPPWPPQKSVSKLLPEAGRVEAYSQPAERTSYFPFWPLKSLPLFP